MISYLKHCQQVPQDAPEPKTCVDLMIAQAERIGDKLAFAFLEDGESVSATLTYRELNQGAQAIAKLLAGRCPQGSRILLLYPSGLDYLLAFFACLSAGMLAVPAYPPRPGGKRNQRLENIVTDSGCCAAMTTTAQLPQMEAALAASPSLAGLEIIYSDLIDQDPPHNWQQPDITMETIAMLQYTSGSTGQPKGVMISHRNLIHNQLMVANSTELTDQDICVTWLPIFHDFGLIGCMLQAVMMGITCYFMAPAYFLQRPSRLLQAISRYRGTVSASPNFAYQMCVDRIQENEKRGLDLSSWRLAFNGSEPVRHETISRFSAAFGPYGFRQCAMQPSYGMAEATLAVTTGSPRHSPPVVFLDKVMLGQRWAVPTDRSSGFPMVGCGGNLRGQTVCIVEPSTCLLCPPGRIGEIWVAGPHISRGYWGQSPTTATPFSGYLTDVREGPFLRTGDLGFIFSGELYVTGRIKDLMIVHGVNYYPQDIEASVEYLSEFIHPAGAVAFQTEGAQGGVVVLAEVKRTVARGIDQALLVGDIRHQVFEDYDLALADIVLLREHSLPKTSSGKVMRGEAKQLYQADRLTRL